MTVHIPTQLFINGEFVDSSNGKTFDCISPADGSVREYILNSVTLTTAIYFVQNLSIILPFYQTIKLL